jgi:hypothetical protein
LIRKASHKSLAGNERSVWKSHPMENISTTPQIRPYSRPGALAKLDQRTKEARFVRETRDELLVHVGGRPSATQRALIEQLVQIRLRLAVMDRRFAETGAQTDHDSRTYLAWANSYARLLRQLGFAAPKEHAQSLTDYLAAKAASEPHTAPGASPRHSTAPASSPSVASSGAPS